MSADGLEEGEALKLDPCYGFFLFASFEGGIMLTSPVGDLIELTCLRVSTTTQPPLCFDNLWENRKNQSQIK